MRKLIILISLYLFIINSRVYSQNNIERYVNSFPIINTEVVQTSELLFQGINASQSEALNYIYNGDTSRLYCIEEEYDMITEKVINKYKIEVFPKKCARVNLDSLILVFYTTNECQNPRSLDWLNLYLAIYSMKYELLKTILIHRESEYDTKMSSLINIKTMKVFQYNYNIDLKNKEFELFELTNKEPYLVTKEKQSGNFSIDNLNKIIQKLGWLEKFEN